MMNILIDYYTWEIEDIDCQIQLLIGSKQDNYT